MQTIAILPMYNVYVLDTSSGCYNSTVFLFTLTFDTFLQAFLIFPLFMPKGSLKMRLEFNVLVVHH